MLQNIKEVYNIIIDDDVKKLHCEMMNDFKCLLFSESNNEYLFWEGIILLVAISGII